nr:hypothetical protein [Bacteroidales bacterium]
MLKYIVMGFACTVGVVLVGVVAACVIMLFKRISDEIDSRERKAKTILDDRNIYLKNQMFEELAYIEKYKKDLEQGKWPREMNQKFEYDEP